MKQDIAEFLTDYFIDFEGKKHYVVVCALSRAPHNDDNYCLAVGYIDNECRMNYDEDLFADVYRTLSIGISVCHPDDIFDEKLGRQIARAKAEKSMPKLVSLTKGIINTKLVLAFMRQEMDFVKKYPNTVIAGYDEKKARLERKLALEEQIRNLDEKESDFVELLINGVDLDKCVTIANYLKNEKTN